MCRIPLFLKRARMAPCRSHTNLMLKNFMCSSNKDYYQCFKENFHEVRNTVQVQVPTHTHTHTKGLPYMHTEAETYTMLPKLNPNRSSNRSYQFEYTQSSPRLPDTSRTPFLLGKGPPHPHLSDVSWGRTDGHLCNKESKACYLSTLPSQRETWLHFSPEKNAVWQ